MRTEILVRQGDDFIVDDATEARYQLASVSKQFTAAAVLLLANDGTLTLDDTIGHWLDGCPDEWQGITLHHLLTHTSGLGHWHDYPMIDLGEWVEPGELLETFHRVPLRYAPGKGWSYSSPAYVLLAHVVERATGIPYRIFLADRIFGPLGLSRTFAGTAQAGVKSDQPAAACRATASVVSVAEGGDQAGGQLVTLLLEAASAETVAAASGDVSLVQLGPEK